jgi:hypothetical protein
MSRKSVLLGIALLALLAGTVSSVLLLLVRHEPDFYYKIGLPPGQERQKHSQEFQFNCVQLINHIRDDRAWQERFTEAQINSYFEEDFVRSGMSESLLPHGISNPRVSFEPNKVRLAFRYGTHPWCSTVVSIDFKVWLAKQETNVVALELQGLHAGSLPVSAQSLLDRISEVVRRDENNAIEITWYRHEGNPVALLRFQANQPRPTVRLDTLQLGQGELIIGGRSVEAAPLRAMLGVPVTAFKPSAN